jgi:hypothetical protein
MTTTTTISELVEAGLLDESAGEPHLTEKGRTWLRTLEDAQTFEVALTASSDEDFVLSTNGLWR